MRRLAFLFVALLVSGCATTREKAQMKQTGLSRKELKELLAMTPNEFEVLMNEDQ